MLNKTYEELLSEKLALIDPKLDKREGSLIYNATAANTAEVIQMLTTLKGYIDLSFADTATREYLIRRAAERDLRPYPATKAKVIGQFNIDVSLGERFSLDKLNYVVVEKISSGTFLLECETEGEIGNQLGTLVPINYIHQLTDAEVTEIAIPGEDEEDTEAFRARYFSSFKSQSFGGNRKDYKEKIKAITGVGGVKVQRAWNGGGTVKLVIVNSDYEQPSSLLINTIQQLVDPVNNQGEGSGIAPIDHVVTIAPVGLTTVNISTEIVLKSGIEWADIEHEAYEKIDAYFKELAMQWSEAQTKEEDETGLVVRISQIETRLLNVSDILDISNTVLNGTASNLLIDPYHIPIRGDVDV